MGAMDKAAKAERIEIRVTPQVKALLATAAQSRHTSISDFLLGHGIEAAEREVASPRVFYASETGWAALQKMLDEADMAAPGDDVAAWIKKPRG